jgi:hypothetical protein
MWDTKKATLLIAHLSKWGGLIMAFNFTSKKDSAEKLLSEQFPITTGVHGGRCDIIERHVQ